MILYLVSLILLDLILRWMMEVRLRGPLNYSGRYSIDVLL
jgi:hypothetical protein